MPVKFISSVLFVRDIQASRHFYEKLLNQAVEIDFTLSVSYVGGFSIWQNEHASQTIFGVSAGDRPPGAKNFELGFEVDDLDAVCARMAQANVPFVHPVVEQPWAQRVFRVYDPDGHIVEIAEPMNLVVRRLSAAGMPVEDVARRVGMPLEVVRSLLPTGCPGSPSAV